MKLHAAPLALLSTALALSAGWAAPPPGAVKPEPWKPAHAVTVPAGVRAPAAASPDTTSYLPDTTWLVKVGPRITRVRDFNTSYWLAYPEDRPKTDSLGRVEFMNTIVKRDLLGLAARARNLPLDFTDRATLRETEERALSDVFYKRFVLDLAQTPESEVREFLQQRAAKGRFRRIVFADRQTAERVRAALVAGRMGWAVAVSQYSLVRPTPKNPDGDMGWVNRMSLGVDVGAPLFRLQPGGITEVVPGGRGGYEVSQMMERGTIPAGSEFAARAYVRNAVRQYHAGLLTDSIQTSIMHRIGMVFDTTNVPWACARFARSLKAEHDRYGENTLVSGATPEFEPEDTSRVLVRWQDGGRYSLGQFMIWYKSLNPLVRPDVTFPGAMTAQVASVVLEPWRAKLARDRGVDRDPEVIARIESKRERLMVERLYQDSVAVGVWVTRDERRAYYDKHLPDFVTFPAVDYALIYRYSRAGADSVRKALDAGAQAAGILAADSLRGEKAGNIMHEGANDHGEFHNVLFEELRPGHTTVVGPDRHGMFGVLQLLTYDPGRQLSFEDSQEILDNLLQARKSEEGLNAFIGRLRTAYPVESRPELVMRFPMVDPADL